MRTAELISVADAVPHLENSMVHGASVAVAGAVGYLLTFALTWLVGKVAFRGRIPRELSRVICLLGAIGVALVVWILLFDRAAESNP